MSEKLVRGLGRWDLTAVAINSIIGAGIFGLPSRVAALVGPYSILVFVLCAVIVGLIVLCFAEVSSRFHSTGGMYLYSREAFGPAIGFEVGWLFWIARNATFAANCNLLLAYLGLFVPGADGGGFRLALIVVLVATLAAVNYVGVRESTMFTNIVTFGKLVPLLLFWLVGIFYLDPAKLSFEAPPSYGSFSGAVLLAIYAFVGFENAVIPAGETKNARSTVPFAIIVAVGSVAVLYILVQLVAVGTLPEIARSERPLADAALIFLGAGGAAFISAGAIISILGNLNTGLLTGSRIPFAMAEQGDLPAILGKTHERFKTPWVSILSTAGFTLFLTLQTSFVTALTISTLSRLIAYAATCAALPVLRRRRDVPNPEFKVPFAPLVTTLSLAFVLWLLSNADYRKEGLAVAVCAVVGIALYFAFRSRNGTPRTKERQ